MAAAAGGGGLPAVDCNDEFGVGDGTATAAAVAVAVVDTVKGPDSGVAGTTVGTLDGVGVSVLWLATLACECTVDEAARATGAAAAAGCDDDNGTAADAADEIGDECVGPVFVCASTVDDDGALDGKDCRADTSDDVAVEDDTNAVWSGPGTALLVEEAPGAARPACCCCCCCC
eukprot:scpid97559/ scgid22756/ 